MGPCEENRSERFLKLYRVLEGTLEKRYTGKRAFPGSVVMEYLKDADSVPVRAELDLCREIRNLLSHNADEAGEPVVEPSRAALDTLARVLEYVQRPRLARNYGTPGDRIVFAHPNDSVLDTMRRMMRMGYSHVPVRDRTGLVGVFSAACLMAFVSGAGFEGLRDDLRIGNLKSVLGFDGDRSEKYLFFDRDATLTTVREAFDRPRERNRRVAAAFVTDDGGQHSEVLAMLTPWDVLKDDDD